MIPADLITDLDLLALDVQAESEFGRSPLHEKRRIAVTQWLRPRLESQGLPPQLHMTRRAPEAAWSLTAGIVTDRRPTLGNRVDEDLDLNAVLVTPGSDALYVGMQAPFRGLFVVLTDTVNANACAASITYWNGHWAALSSLVDGTQAVAGKSFSGGGRITWGLPDDWIMRPIGTSDVSSHAYYVRIQVNSPLSGATLVSQLLPLAFSRLTNPAALHALGLLYRESMGSNRGSEAYQRKAEMFLEAADRELELVLPMVQDEFDIDRSGAVETTEAQSVMNIDQLTTWERG